MTTESRRVHLAARPQHMPGVVGRVTDGEAVLVHPSQGKVRVLNGVGTRIWELTDGARTVGDIADVISTEYQVDPAQAESDAMAFCIELVERGLLTLNR